MSSFYLCIREYIIVTYKIISEKRGHKFEKKTTKEGYMRESGGGKRRDKWCNSIILSKTKRNNFKPAYEYVTFYCRYWAWHYPETLKLVVFNSSDRFAREPHHLPCRLHQEQTSMLCQIPKTVRLKRHILRIHLERMFWICLCFTSHTCKLKLEFKLDQVGAESQVWVICFAGENASDLRGKGLAGSAVCCSVNSLMLEAVDLSWDSVLWRGLVSCWKLDIDACFSVFFSNFCL